MSKIVACQAPVRNLTQPKRSVIRGEARLALRLPQAHGVAFGILHPCKCAGGDVHRRNQCLATERLRLFQRRSHIFDVDIKNRVLMRFVPQRRDVSPNSGSYRRDHSRWPQRFNSPVEHLGVKLMRLLGITATYLKMYDRTPHEIASSFRGTQRMPGSLPQSTGVCHSTLARARRRSPSSIDVSYCRGTASPCTICELHFFQTSF